MIKLAFRGGKNIALKIPSHVFEKSVSFYQDVLGMRFSGTSSCDFGQSRLWLDRVAGPVRSEVWLELITNDVEQARAILKAQGYEALNKETLPEGFRGFWIKSPAGIIHLVSAAQDE
jgi:catechol 2,3-dioxygenase-like lactoylglutathione lyase family enzyme